VLHHRVEQTTFERKNRGHLSPLKSELPGGNVDTTGIATYLMEQIPDRASHIFDPEPQFISRVEKLYFSNRLRRPSLEIQTV
jgi:hypothetical protein